MVEPSLWSWELLFCLMLFLDSISKSLVSWEAQVLVVSCPCFQQWEDPAPWNFGLLLYSSGSQLLQCCDPLIRFLVLWWPPNHKITLLLLHNCNFATVMNFNEISVFSNALRLSLWKGHSHNSQLTGWEPVGKGFFIGSTQKKGWVREAQSWFWGQRD